MFEAGYWIRKLDLRPHPDGGYFRETYRAPDRVNLGGLPARYTGSRHASTAIYYLLPGEEVNQLHRLHSDEMWHFYTGSPLTLHLIHPNGTYEARQLGPEPGSGQAFQVLVPAGCWFGATVDDPEGYTLVGCTVAPGFDLDDFERLREQGGVSN